MIDPNNQSLSLVLSPSTREMRDPGWHSVVVSKFATFRYRSPSELRNQNDTRNQYVASVLSIPKFAKRRYRDVANFGIGTLAAIGRAVRDPVPPKPFKGLMDTPVGCYRP